MAWWAEPLDRELSPGRGLEDPGRRAAAAAAQGKGVLIRGPSGNFIGGFRAHLQPGNRREGLHRLGASVLNGLVSRGPRPGHSRPSYVKFTRLGRGRLGYPRDLGPERIERPSEQLRKLAVARAQEADQITAP
jgi:hypothetical protein